MQTREGAALVSEHEALMSQFNTMVSCVLQSAEELARLSPAVQDPYQLGACSRVHEATC